MTIAPAPIVSRPSPAHEAEKGSRLSNLLRTTDHKTIGLMYLTASFVVLHAGGLMALLMRGELARPELQFLSPEQYNQLFTMHGTIMLLLFATPLFFAFANLIMPLQIGAPDVAFPRLNAFSFWLFLFGVSIAVSGFLTPGGAADFGWYAYTPLSDGAHSPGRRREPVDRRPGRQRSGHDPRWRQLHRHDRLPAGAGHDACSGCRSSPGTRWSPAC